MITEGEVVITEGEVVITEGEVVITEGKIFTSKEFHRNTLRMCDFYISIISTISTLERGGRNGPCFRSFSSTNNSTAIVTHR